MFYGLKNVAEEPPNFGI